MIFDPNAIDAFGVRKDGGADLLIVPAGPPDGSPETQQALLDKVEAYLGYVHSDAFRTECPNAAPENTRILLRLEEEPPAPLAALIQQILPWAAEYGASFRVQIKA